MNKSILIVEDNLAIREIIVEFISAIIDTKEIKIFKTGKESEAGEILKNEEISLLITDINLGGKRDGLSLVDALKQKPRPYIIVMSSIERLGKVDSYLKNGTVDTFLSKPFSWEDLKSKLRDSQVVKFKEKTDNFFIAP